MKLESTKASRAYKVVDEKGNVKVDGSLKDLRDFFEVGKGKRTVVRDLCNVVNKTCIKHGYIFTIDGKTFEEAYPKK